MPDLDPIAATAYSVVVPGGDWAWTVVGGDEEFETALLRAKGVGGWLMADGKVIGDYRQNPKAAEGPAEADAHPADHHGFTAPPRTTQADCAGSGPDPEGAGGVPGADGGVEGAETAQEPAEANIEAALLAALNRQMGAVGWCTPEVAAEYLAPVAQQLIDQSRAAGRAEADNAILWGVDCVRCAKRLDEQYAADMETEVKIRKQVTAELRDLTWQIEGIADNKYPAGVRKAADYVHSTTQAGAMICDHQLPRFVEQLEQEHQSR